MTINDANYDRNTDQYHFKSKFSSLKKSQAFLNENESTMIQSPEKHHSAIKAYQSPDFNGRFSNVMSLNFLTSEGKDFKLISDQKEFDTHKKLITEV